MTLVDQINQARSPRDAILLLAAAIDELRAAPPADPWQDWGDVTSIDITKPDLLPQVDESDPGEPEYKTRGQLHREAVEANKAEVAHVRAAISAASDPDERKALQAELSLLQNPGLTPEPDAGGAQLARCGDDIAALPVSPERMEQRRNFARNVNLHTFISPLSEEEAIDAYAKGGPMWLYEGNREAVMALPYGARQVMCADIEQDSLALATDVSRDILMHRDSVSAAVATEALQKMVDFNG